MSYYMQTWNEPNKMGTIPVFEQGTMYIEAVFSPGVIDSIDIQKYLESGKNPVGLFKFRVTNIGNKEIN